MAAPDFGDGFPSSGERIGPAWKAGWNLLDSERWTLESDLLREMRKHDIADKTANSLVSGARLAGVVGVKRVGKEWAYRRSVLWRSDV